LYGITVHTEIAKEDMQFVRFRHKGLRQLYENDVA
jgi:addiction module HigA family antidote